MIEIWLDCNEDHNYMVSSHGRVKSKSRWIKCGPSAGKRLIDGRLIKPYMSKTTGYFQVQLSNRKKANVHRLIADAFVAGYMPGLVVNHIDGDKTNNRAGNLEWVSHSENHLHSYKVLGRKGSQTGKFSSLHHVSRPVVSVCMATGEKEQFACALDAVRKYGFDSGSISKCCYGKQRSHKGRIWKFSDKAMMSYPEARASR